MTNAEFIEKHCVVKHNGRISNIRLKDYQKKFLKYLESLKK